MKKKRREEKARRKIQLLLLLLPFFIYARFVKVLRTKGGGRIQNKENKNQSRKMQNK